jgi:hypothetical protein
MSSVAKKLFTFMKPEGSSPHSEEPALYFPIII